MGNSPAKSSCLPKIPATGFDVTFEYFEVKKQPAFSRILYIIFYLIFLEFHA